jgi:hypothetical protein
MYSQLTLTNLSVGNAKNDNGVVDQDVQRKEQNSYI